MTLDDLELILDGHYAFFYITHLSFGANTKIRMKIDPYYQQQKCRPKIIVSSDIRFMQIFAGFAGQGVK